MKSLGVSMSRGSQYYSIEKHLASEAKDKARELQTGLLEVVSSVRTAGAYYQLMHRIPSHGRPVDYNYAAVGQRQSPLCLRHSIYSAGFYCILHPKCMCLSTRSFVSLARPIFLVSPAHTPEYKCIENHSS